MQRVIPLAADLHATFAPIPFTMPAPTELAEIDATH